jgi:hypothetical protein
MPGSRKTPRARFRDRGKFGMPKPLYVEFDVEHRRVRVVYQTQPSFEQWKTTIVEVVDDPRFQPGFGILLDRSRILKPATPEYMRRLVEFIDQLALKTDARWAIVASDLASFGMGRNAEMSASKANVRTFTDRNSAEYWLCGKVADSRNT